jgi:Squalene-hopene cyclase C-terminal domain
VSAPSRFRSPPGGRRRATLLTALGGSSRRPSSARPLSDAHLAEHLEATYRWLCAAQDATPDGGVAGWFDLLWGRWSSSYPETTGYIIPTFLALARARGEPPARSRALRMAAWEADIQMPDGAVLSGVLGTPRGPAVFNTGQVLLGWLAAFEDTGEARYARCATAAAEWLVRRQDADGAWRRSLSVVTSAPVHTFNGRCTWALAYAACVLGEERFMQAARRGSDWVLAQQNAHGWFAHNGFAADEVPLLHTICYVIEGLLGVYGFTGESCYLEAARAALDPLVAAHRAGRLVGRLDARWRATVSWRCVTGEAQLAVVLHRLERHRPGEGYAQAARSLIEGVARIQLRLCGLRSDAARLLANAPSPARGGVPGSFPVWGAYARLALPNWAAKFHLDALLLELHGTDELSAPQLPPPPVSASGERGGAPPARGSAAAPPQGGGSAT